MEQKSKIFHIIHALRIGGVETAALSSLDVLNDWCDFRLLVIDKDPSNFELPESIKKNVIIFNGNHAVDVANYYKIIKYIIEEKPNIIITSLWRSVFTILVTKLIFRDFRWITFFHSTSYKHSWDKVFNKIGFQSSDYVLVDSEKARNFVAKWIPSSKISIISFLRQKNTRLNNDNFNDLKMVYIGRLDPMKGIDVGIKLQHYLMNYFNFSLSFDVYGPYEKHIENLKVLAHDLQVKDFNYCGLILPQNVLKTLTYYNLFFQASKYEGMAMSVVEAMQQGLVCIVTPVGEIQNYSKHLISAIHINDSKNTDFEETARLLRNKTILKSISVNAQNIFTNSPTYSESLLAFLQLLQHKA